MDHPLFTRKEASDIALAAAKEASRETLTEIFSLFNVNIANFDSMQAFREDLEWARRARKLAAQTGMRAWTAAITIIAGAIAVGLWEGIRSFIMRQP